MDMKLVYIQKIWQILSFYSCFLCKSRKSEIKIKASDIFMREKKKTFYVNRYTKIFKVSYSLHHPIEKAGSATLFSYEDAFPSVSLSVKKLFINDSDSRWNENNLMSQDEC